MNNEFPRLRFTRASTDLPVVAGYQHKTPAEFEIMSSGTQAADNPTAKLPRRGLTKGEIGSDLTLYRMMLGYFTLAPIFSEYFYFHVQGDVSPSFFGSLR